MRIFGYGSLASPTSLTASLGVPVPAPSPAFLPGHRSGLVVGTDTRELADRYWTRSDGSVFDGVIASYGLLPAPHLSPDDGCLGAVHEVPEALLPVLDARERDYARVPVTVFDEAGRGVAAETYVQHRDSERVLHDGLAAGRAVVTQEYLDLVADALAALEPDVHRRAAAPTHVPVVPLVFHEGSPPLVG